MTLLVGKLSDWYVKKTEFDFIMNDALTIARTPVEETFVHRVSEEFDNQGLDMPWSEAQDRMLRRIAGPDDF